MAEFIVRPTAPGRYAVHLENGDTALVTQQKVMGQHVWICHYCQTDQISCAHVAAVRGARRQAFLEDE